MYKEVSKVYKKKQAAVKSLSLAVQDGSCLALLGPNGAGKTTTLHMLCGFLYPTSGSVRVYDKEVHENLAQVQRGIGFCPQFDLLWPRLTGEEHLRIYAKLRGIADVEEQVAAKLEAVQLVEAKDKAVEAYSGGMKRRLSVALALIGDPDLVILDEPTTGMDPVSRRQVWDLIQSSKRPGRVIVLTTHSMEEADALSDKVAILAQGSLQAVGSTLELKQSLGRGLIVSLSTTKPKKVKKFFRGAHFSESAGESSKSVRLSFAIADQNDFSEKLEGFDEVEHGVTAMQVRLSTLEEVFLSVVEDAQGETERQ